MSESEGQSNQSPLLSDRGVTTISDSVVTQLAGMAAQEVEGVHMGGGASRTASGVLGSITGSESKTSGVSAEVGRTETAIDLKMGIEYNRNILQTVEEVRQRITERIEEMTGLRIKELNATITDITFPEKEARRRIGPARPASDSDTSSGAQTAPEGEPTEEETAEVEPTEVEPTSRTHTEGSSGPVPEEEVSVEGRTLEEDETAEVRIEEETTKVHIEEQMDEAPAAPEETPAETETTAEASAEPETPESETPEPETPEPETPEARMRRRAEERARRRRRRSQDS